MRIENSAPLLLAAALAWPAPLLARDNGIPVDKAAYANRPLLADFTAPDCPNTPRSLTQIKDNLAPLEAGHPLEEVERMRHPS